LTATKKRQEREEREQREQRDRKYPKLWRDVLNGLTGHEAEKNESEERHDQY
jgi:hypothetical protein